MQDEAMHGKRAGVQRFMDGSCQCCDLCTETLSITFLFSHI